jgi:hypothetical protein
LGLIQAIAATIESCQIPAIQSVVRWRLIDLGQWVFAFHITIAKHSLSWVLHGSGRCADVV